MYGPDRRLARLPFGVPAGIGVDDVAHQAVPHDVDAGQRGEVHVLDAFDPVELAAIDQACAEAAARALEVAAPASPRPRTPRPENPER